MNESPLDDVLDQVILDEQDKLRRGRALLHYLRNDCVEVKLYRINRLKEVLCRVENEFNTLKEKFGLEELTLKESTIQNVQELNAKLESAMSMRDIGTLGCLSSIVGKLIVNVKNGPPVLKLILTGAGFLTAKLANDQRKEIKKLAAEIRDALSQDSERFKALARAAEDFDKALIQYTGLSLFSEEFHKFCKYLSVAPCRIEEDSVMSEILESLGQNLQEMLKNISKDEKLKDMFKKLANDTVLKYIQNTIVSHYACLIFEVIPDALSGDEAELILLPVLGACHVMLLVNERTSDALLLSEVQDGMMRMKLQHNIMVMVNDYCRELTS